MRRTQPTTKKTKISSTTHVQMLQWLHGKQQQLASLRQVRNVLYKRKQHGGFVILIMIFGKLRMFPTVVRIRVLAKFGSRALYLGPRGIFEICLMNILVNFNCIFFLHTVGDRLPL